MMNTYALVLDQHTQAGKFLISGEATKIQLKVSCPGLDEKKNVYVQVSANGKDFGQTLSVTSEPTWVELSLPSPMSGETRISRPFYGEFPETVDGASLAISGVRWK